jgi:GNAT superfamily N-acetyltransferase
MTSLQLEAAKSGDIPRIWTIICQGREQMRLAGSLQWQDSYPALADIEADIAAGCGYVLRCGENAGENAIAYAAVIFDGEPAYGKIKGQWLADRPYAVVHRLAVADEMKRRGIASLFMRGIERLSLSRGISSVRVDTNFDNQWMIRILSKLGFAYCGEVVYDRNKRMAYEKILPQ